MSDEDITRRLHDTTDAQAWAQEFCKRFSIYGEHGEIIDDPEGLMIGWFANAMEVAKAHARKRSAADCDDPWVCCIHTPPSDVETWNPDA